ncbi:unnamed protein product, partial [Mesorhabditis belari]|uniref:ShKT domain-containing protein n=1 Tax=Mesorhabditis belari TaxID=2138241 RepID=A0AAF3F5V2_9BILA
MTRWNDHAKEEAAKKKTVALPPGVKEGWAPDLAPIVSSLEACMDMACVCRFLAGSQTSPCTLNGKPVKKVLRKEYRMMTDIERQKFHAVILQLKQNGKFDEMAKMHSSMGMSGGAHGGPAFAVWHREFVKRVEMELRKIDPDVFLPYWDSTLEWRLPRGQDSSLFSAELMGNPTGNINIGPFANFRAIDNRFLTRNTGGEGQPFSDQDISVLLQQTVLNGIMAYSPSGAGCPIRPNYYSLESMHGNVHLWIGGHMTDPETSANDPIFYLHHCFVDMLFEIVRQQNQDRGRRETEYPPDNGLCSNAQHFSGARMAPFNQYRNIDGLSNKYTDELYTYDNRPSCTQTNPSCGSRFLFCDLSHGQPRCASKIRVGGSCQGYTAGEDACYNGKCQNSVCVASSVPVSTVAPVVSTISPPVTLPPQLECWNENQCCQSWAGRGECTRNTQYMRDFCKASCNICTANPPLRDDCSDRAPSCAQWSRTGECTRNPDWMAENCRRSCNKCQMTRAQACAVGAATTTPSPVQRCEEISPGCYNEFACCPLWANQGQCRTNQAFMACNCRVSCGMCNPTDYPYGACVDYHQSCSAWARGGECQKNPWMEENCRRSCGTCFAQWELPNMCGSTAQAGLIANRRQSGMNTQPVPQSGWLDPRQNDAGWNGGQRQQGGWNQQPQWGQQQWNGGGAGGAQQRQQQNWRNAGRGQMGGGGWGFNSWGRRRRDASAQSPSGTPNAVKPNMRK